MKQPKKPTLAQKKMMSKAGLDWKKYGVIRERKDVPFPYLEVMERKTGERRTIVTEQ